MCAFTHPRLCGHLRIILKRELSTIFKKVKVAIVSEPNQSFKNMSIFKGSFKFSVHRTPGCWVFLLSPPQPNQNGKGFAHRQWPQDSHLFRMPEVIRSIKRSEEAHGYPHQRKGLQLCSMPEIIWWSWNPEEAHAHSQWSEGSHLLRMWEVIWSSRTLEEAHDHPH